MKKITKEKLSELLTLGKTAKEIAHLFEMNPNSIRHLIRKYNFQYNKPDPLPKEQLIQFVKLGYNTKRISEIINLPYYYVQHRMNKYQLNYNKRDTLTKNVDENYAQCSKCNEIKIITEFPLMRPNLPSKYRLSYCTHCRYIQSRENVFKDLNRLNNERYTRLKNRCHLKNIPFNISKEEFIEQYNNQKGKCFYTDFEFNEKAYQEQKISRNGFSIDKIIPQLGYIKGNIVFCSTYSNAMKLNSNLLEVEKYLPSFYKRIKNFWKNNYPEFLKYIS